MKHKDENQLYILMLEELDECTKTVSKAESKWDIAYSNKRIQTLLNFFCKMDITDLNQLNEIVYGLTKLTEKSYVSEILKNRIDVSIAKISM